MTNLKRRLYGLVIRMHPVAFRDEFGREMALDFEDALGTFGVARLWLDALHSLTRQWTTHLISPAAEPAKALTHSMLAGSYAQVNDQPMRPMELARGLIAATTLISLCCFALNSSRGRAPDLGIAYAASATPGPHAALARAVQALAQAAQPKPELLLYHPSAPLPSYEVATIKPVNPDDASSMVKLPPGATLSPLSIRRYIMNAYGAVYAAQVVGGPDWLNKDAYDIKGKFPDDLEATYRKMASQDRINQDRAMQQSLLADRFHLKAHFETRVLPVYELVPAKGGLKIPEVAAPPERKAGDPPVRVRTGGALPPGTSMTSFNSDGLRVLNARAINMEWLGRIVGGDLGDRPIVNHTGFTGYFDITDLAWAPLGDANADSGPDALSLSEALEKRLGVKVQSAKAPIEVLVIDSIERPSEN